MAITETVLNTFFNEKIIRCQLLYFTALTRWRWNDRSRKQCWFTSVFLALLLVILISQAWEWNELRRRWQPFVTIAHRVVIPFLSLGALLFSTGKCSMAVCGGALLACALCWVSPRASVPQLGHESGNLSLPTIHPGHAVLPPLCSCLWLPSFPPSAVPPPSCAAQLLPRVCVSGRGAPVSCCSVGLITCLRLLPVWVLPVGAAVPQRRLSRWVPPPQLLLWQLLCQEALGAALVTSSVPLVLMVEVPCLGSVQLEQGHCQGLGCLNSV